MWLPAVVLCVLMGLHVTQSYNQASPYGPTNRQPLNVLKNEDQTEELTAKMERLRKEDGMIFSKLGIMRVSSNINTDVPHQFPTLLSKVNNEIAEQDSRLNYLNTQSSRINNRLKEVVLRVYDNSRLIGIEELLLAKTGENLGYSTGIAAEINVKVDSGGYGKATLKYSDVPIELVTFVRGFQYFPNKRPLFFTYGKGLILQADCQVDHNQETFGTMTVSVNFTPLEIALAILGNFVPN